MQIYTYYTDCQDLPGVDELKLINLWRRGWQLIGWEPVVLKEYHARRHPEFEIYDKAVSALPSVNPPGYDRACFLRWLALAVAGGGYMADYDCFPSPGWKMGCFPDIFPLTGEQGNRLQIFQSCCPSLVYAWKPTAEALCKALRTGSFKPRTINGKPHYSDMYCLEDILLTLECMNGNKPFGIQTHDDLVTHYGAPGWEKRPYVHFSHQSMADLKGPRWQHIARILRIENCA